MFIRVIINHSGIFEIIIHIFLCVLNFLNGYHLIKDGCGSVYNQQMSSNGNKNISISRAKKLFLRLPYTVFIPNKYSVCRLKISIKVLKISHAWVYQCKNQCQTKNISSYLLKTKMFLFSLVVVFGRPSELTSVKGFAKVTRLFAINLFFQLRKWSQ